MKELRIQVLTWLFMIAMKVSSNSVIGFSPRVDPIPLILRIIVVRMPQRMLAWILLPILVQAPPRTLVLLPIQAPPRTPPQSRPRPLAQVLPIAQ